MKGRWIRRALLTLAALGVVACAIVAVAGLRDDLDQCDVALVLGNKVELDGRPSPSLQARLDRALELYRAGWFPRIVVSGGLGKEGFDEAVVMGDFLVSQGVPAQAVIADSQGWTTYDSGRNLAALAKSHGWKSVMVVTQYYHVPRSRLAVRKSGFTIVRSAHAYHFAWKDFYALPREVLGLVSYWLR